LRKQSRLGPGLAVLLSSAVFGATYFPSHASHASHHRSITLPSVQLASAVLPAFLPLATATSSTTSSSTTTSTTAPRPVRPRTTTTRPRVVTTTTTTTVATTTAAAATPDVWARLRACESHGDYTENTGNGYYGAYQFSAATWHSMGYPGLPSDAPPAQQDEAAHRLKASGGWRQWPACARQLGLR